MSERDIEKAYCSCGGEVEQVDTTGEEEVTYGCGCKGCCLRAYECKRCGTRFTLRLEAPEIA